MDEVRRFLRFALPGMASLGQFFLAIYLTRSQAIESLLQKLDSQADIIGAVVAVFITSGAIGYIFASAYHPLYWTIFSWFSIDHLTIVRKLISLGKLLVTDIDGNPIPRNKLKKRDAWTILKDPSDRQAKICPKTGENGPERVNFRVDKHWRCLLLI